MVQIILSTACLRKSALGGFAPKGSFRVATILDILHSRFGMICLDYSFASQFNTQESLGKTRTFSSYFIEIFFIF